MYYNLEKSLEKLNISKSELLLYRSLKDIKYSEKTDKYDIDSVLQKRTLTMGIEKFLNKEEKDEIISQMKKYSSLKFTLVKKLQNGIKLSNNGTKEQRIHRLLGKELGFTNIISDSCLSSSNGLFTSTKTWKEKKEKKLEKKIIEIEEQLEKFILKFFYNSFTEDLEKIKISKHKEDLSKFEYFLKYNISYNSKLNRIKQNLQRTKNKLKKSQSQSYLPIWFGKSFLKGEEKDIEKYRLKRLELNIEGNSKIGNQFVRIEYSDKNNNKSPYQLKLFNKIIPDIKISNSHKKTFTLDNFNLQTCRISFNKKGKLILNITYSYIKPIKLYNTNRSKGTIGIDIGPKEIAICLVKNDGNPFLYKHYSIGNLLDKKTDDTNRQISLILDKIIQLGIDNEFYQITIEDLELTNKNYGNKNLNRLLNKFPREIFKSLITSKTSRRGIKLKIVNPAYTSIIGLFKYSNRDNLSTNHNSSSHDLSAALVIGRRGLGFREKFKIDTKSKIKRPSVKIVFGESEKELNNLNNREKNFKLWYKLNRRFPSVQSLTAYLDVKTL